MRNLLLANAAKAPPAQLFFCKVTRFYASSNTVDVVTIDNNTALLGCQIACSLPAGFTFGQRYIPSHDDTSSETGHIMSPGDIYCIAAYINGDYYNSAVIGFLFPKETALSIPDYGLYLFRHESDVMWMVRTDGTVQMYHPSGSTIKIGSDDTNEMSPDIMKPTKVDNAYIRDSAKYNEKHTANFYVQWHQGQKIIIDSEGNLVIKTRDDATTFTMTAEGNLTVSANSDINISTTASVNIDADVGVNVTTQQVNLIKG